MKSPQNLIKALLHHRPPSLMRFISFLINTFQAFGHLDGPSPVPPGTNPANLGISSCGQEAWLHRETWEH